MTRNQKKMLNPPKNTNRKPYWRRRFQFISFQYTLKKEAQQTQAQKKPEKVQKNHFAFEEFEKAWNQYAQQKQEEGKSNIAALFSIAQLTPKGDQLIHIKVPSDINKVELERECKLT